MISGACAIVYVGGYCLLTTVEVVASAMLASAVVASALVALAVVASAVVASAVVMY